MNFIYVPLDITTFNDVLFGMFAYRISWGCVNSFGTYGKKIFFLDLKVIRLTI